MINNQPKIIYFEYLRKSSEEKDRQILSIPAQKNEVLKLFPHLYTFKTIEESKSAFTPYNRPGFQEILNTINANRSKNIKYGIISWSPDRLSRNEIDASQITYLYRTGVIDLQFCSFRVENSPEGIMMLQHALTNSQYSSAKLSRDVKRGMRAKAGTGWFPGVAKPGYMNDLNGEKGYKQVFPHPTDFSLVNKAIRKVLNREMSVYQARNYLNNDLGYRTPQRKTLGGKPIAHSSFYKMLSDTFYYGEYEYPKGSGIWTKGKHKPMITREEFDIIQNILGKPNPRPRSFSSIVEAMYGVLACGECSSSYSPDKKVSTICTNCKTKFSSKHKVICPQCHTAIKDMISPKHFEYLYYRCSRKKKPSCKQGAIEAKELDKQILELLGNIKISEKMKDWYIRRLNEANNEEAKDRTNIRKSLQDNLADCDKRSDNLLQIKISPQNINGDILSDEEFFKQKKKITKEKNEIRDKLKQVEDSSEKWTDLAVDTFNFACYASYHYEKGDAETKKSILLGLGANLTVKDRKVLVLLPPHLETIKKAHKLTINLNIRCETGISILKHNKTGTLVPALNSLLPLTSLIRTCFLK